MFSVTNYFFIRTVVISIRRRVYLNEGGILKYTLKFIQLRKQVSGITIVPGVLITFFSLSSFSLFPHSTHNDGERSAGQTGQPAVRHPATGAGRRGLHGALVQGGGQRATVQLRHPGPPGGPGTSLLVGEILWQAGVLPRDLPSGPAAGGRSAAGRRRRVPVPGGLSQLAHQKC